MAEAREHPALTEEALGAALLLIQGQLPGIRAGRSSLTLLINGESLAVEVEELTGSRVQFLINARRFVVEFESKVPETKKLKKGAAKAKSAASGDGIVRAPIPGVVAALLVKEGETIAEGTQVIRIEAMKMQNALSSQKAGIVKKIYVELGAEVAEGDALIEIG